MSAEHVPGGSHRENRAGLMLSLVLAVCGIWAYWPTLVRITGTWAKNPDYSHGYFVVPLALLLLWLRRSTRPNVDWGIHPAGLLLLVAVGLLRYVAGRLYLPEFDAWSIPLWIIGTCWTLAGWPVARWALLPIAFLWFATPLPGAVDTFVRIPLQQLAARGSGIVLQMLGQPAVVEGTTILLGDQTLEVETACSGLRMFYGIAAVAVATILITQPSRRKAMLLLAAIAPVALFVNVMRITVSGMSASWTPGGSSASWMHDLSGIVAIPVAVVLFVGLLKLAEFAVASWRDDPRRTMRMMAPVLVTFLVLVPACIWWYGVQRAKSLSTLVETARRHEEASEWSAAAKYLARYHRARPDDSAQLAHWAEVYSKAALVPASKLRAAELLRAAYQAEPKRRDLGLQAINMAAETQSFRMALGLIDELQRADGGADEGLQIKRAEILLAFLQSPSGNAQSDYSWGDVSEALATAIARPEYSARLAAALAVVTREHLTEPDEKQRAAQADQLINRVIAERESDPEAWFARYCYARQYWVGDALTRADADLDEAVERCDAAAPERQVEILLAAAERARRNHTLDEAVKLLQRAALACPTDARPYLALADAERQTQGAAGEQASIEVLRRGLQATGGRSLELAMALAGALSEAGNEAESEEVLRPIREMSQHLDDESARGYLSIGIANIDSVRQQNAGRLTDAARTLRVALDSTNLAIATTGNRTGPIEQAWRRLGNLYRALGRTDEAMEAFRQVLRLRPDSPADRQAFVQTALASGDVLLAVEESTRRVKSEPTSGDAWVSLAIAQLQQQLRLPADRRDLSEVSRSLSQAWKLSATKGPLLLASVDLLRAQRRWGEARKLLEKSLQQDAEQPQLWQALVVVSLDQADFAAASRSAKAFAVHGGGALEAATLEASVLTSSGRGPEARELLKKVGVKVQGRDQLRASQMAAVLDWQLGNSAQAQAALEAVHQANPSELEPVELLARFAAEEKQWTQLARWEHELKRLEGDDGSLWKAYRVIRLLSEDQQLDVDQLAELERLVQQIASARPRWAMSHYLLAQMAMRRGRRAEAVDELEATWQLGDHSTDVAVQLFSLLVEMGRRADANRYIGDLGDMPLVSPGLFDRVMPLLFQTGRSDQAVARARQWATENPQNGPAQVRLGRTLLLYASTLSDEDKRRSQLAASEAAFQEALRLNPSDLTSWTSLFAYYLQTQRPADATELLARFDREANFEPVEKELVLARLNGAMPRPANAVRHWRRAIDRAAEQPDRAVRVATLTQAAEYFSIASAPLAERYCRQALALDADAPEPAMLLVSLLSSRADPKAVEEAITTARKLVTRSGAIGVGARRQLARLLTQRNASGDGFESISLLELQPAKDTDEKLLLALNYSRVGRTGSAYELLDDVAAAPAPRLSDLAAFLSFWQDNFQAEGLFANRAQEVIARLGQLPQGLPEQLRWKLRLAQAKGEKNTNRDVGIRDVLVQFWASRPVAQALESDRSSQELLYGVLRVLLEEGRVETAIDVCRRPPGKISPPFAARLLANIMMKQRLSDAAQVSAGMRLLDEMLATHPNDMLLLQDAGDLAALSGDSQQAEVIYRRILSIDPNQRDALGNLVTLIGEDPRRRQEALKLVDEAIAKNPDDKMLLGFRGGILRRMNRIPEAVETLSRAAGVVPPRATVYLQLALALEQSGDTHQAEEALAIATAVGIGEQPIVPNDRDELVGLRQKFNL